MILSVFAQVMLPILFVVASGFAFKKLTDFDVRPASRVSLYLFSPALIFSSLVEAEIGGEEALRAVAFMLVLTAILGTLTLLVGVSLRYDRATKAALLLCTMFSNTGNYGLPLALFAFGQAGFEAAIVFFVTQGILTQTLGIYIAGSGQAGWREGVSGLLRMPQLYSVFAALAIRYIGPEYVTDSGNLANDIYRGVDLMGQAAIPVLLVVLGAQLAGARIEAGEKTLIGIATAIKLLIAVPLSYAIARLLGFDDLTTGIAVILGSMPTAVNVVILATEFDIRPKLVSSTVIVSTAASFVTLTVLISVFGGG
ncbi:AEC family transporter [Rubrobacter indicoceani]|uniref:AEC family transporter n=1 Tax=Rubrobacter indicoceani TaxID=2051957 RepID=UPI000E5C1103|nr:AEC family transporter [Rubrobacter indicoceani]